MPVTRPSDEGQDRAQWWKDASREQMEGDIPEGPAANNKQGAGKNKFEEEQEQVRHTGD